MNVLDLLAESLELYLKVLKRHWAVLAAVYLPVAAVVVWLHWETVSYFSSPLGIPMDAIKLPNNVGNWLEMLFGSVAATIVVRSAWRLLAQPDDETEMTEGGFAAWWRFFGTELLMAVLLGFYACVVAIALVVVGVLLARAIGLLALFLALALLAVGIFFGVKLFVPWALALTASALFRMSGFGAMKMSRRVLGGRLWAFFGYSLVAGLVTASAAVSLRLLREGELLNLVHPLSAGAWSWVFLVLMLAGEVLAMVAGTYLWVALVVYLRRTAALRTTSLSVPRGVPLALACCGGTLVAILLVCTGMRGVKGPQNLDEARVFHEKNMEFKCLASGAFGHDPYYLLKVAMNGLPDDWPRRGWVEKQTIWDRMNDLTVVWFELPGCSQCEHLWDPSEGFICQSDHLPDIAVKSHMKLQGDAFTCGRKWDKRIGPNDRVRPLTDAELELFRKMAADAAAKEKAEKKDIIK